MKVARRRHGRTGKRRKEEINGRIIVCRKVWEHAGGITGEGIDRGSGRCENPENLGVFPSQFSFSHENPPSFIREFSRFSRDSHMRILIGKAMRIIFTEPGG